MKKLLVSLSALLLCACSATSADTVKAGSAAVHTKDLDMSGYRFLEDEDPNFIQISIKEAVSLFDQKGTALILFSEDNCEWCNRAVPVLNEAAKKADYKVFYVDLYEEETVSLPQEESSALLKDLYNALGTVTDYQTNPTNGKSEPYLNIPLVTAVKDGKVIASHKGLTDGFEIKDKEKDQLSEEQKAELMTTYEALIYCVSP